MFFEKLDHVKKGQVMNLRCCLDKFLSMMLIVLLACLSSNAQAVQLADYPKLQAIADELIEEKHYTQAQLDVIFSDAVVKQSVLDAMTSPAEYKFTWGKYRKLFLQEDRIQQGAEFWQEHQAVFDRAEAQYGVPGSIIAAIVGVESKYGKYKGKHKVIDSLVTLVVGFPRRSKFFASELKEFLILTKENNLDFKEIKGSYAGAVGFPQFISSSYRNYAVDFTGDGFADLINDPHDAIGSIANYFVENGWLKGQPVTSPVHRSIPNSLKELANRKRKIQFTAKDLKAKGAVLSASIDDQEKLNVLMLDASEVYNEPRSNNAYIVRSGDTICAIARKYEVPCQELIELNKINQKGDIFRGQRLKLPPQKDTKQEAAVKASKDVAESSEKKGKWVIGGKAVESNKTNKAGSSSVKTETKKSESVNTEAEPIYFYTHENFYVITRYNHSVLYAMAVHDLSREIAIAKAKLDAKNNLRNPL